MYPSLVMRWISEMKGLKVLFDFPFPIYVHRHGRKMDKKESENKILFLLTNRKTFTANAGNRNKGTATPMPPFIISLQI